MKNLADGLNNFNDALITLESTPATCLSKLLLSISVQTHFRQYVFVFVFSEYAKKVRASVKTHKAHKAKRGNEVFL